VKSYTSFNDRTVATMMGVTYNFKAGVPVDVQENTIRDVEVAGITTTEAYNALIAGKAPPLPPEVEAAPVIETLTDDGEDLDIEGELRELRYAEAERKREWEEAEAIELAEKKAAEEALEAEKEKSPRFDQVVFEAAVREILEASNEGDLTPKGMPKAKLVSRLCGFDVQAIKIVQYCKSLED